MQCLDNWNNEKIDIKNQTDSYKQISWLKSKVRELLTDINKMQSSSFNNLIKIDQEDLEVLNYCQSFLEENSVSKHQITHMIQLLDILYEDSRSS